MKNKQLRLLTPFTWIMCIAAGSTAFAKEPANSSNSKPHLPSLIEMLKSDQAPELRAEAAKTLGKFSKRQAFPALCAQLDDENEMVRQAVKTALNAHGGEAACEAYKVVLHIECSGDAPENERLKQKFSKEFSQNKLILQEGAQNQNKYPGCKIKLALSHQVESTETSTLVHCAIAQSIFDDQSLAFRGSATQRATIDLDLASAPNEEIQSGLTDCYDTLYPIIRDNLNNYIEKLLEQ